MKKRIVKAGLMFGVAAGVSGCIRHDRTMDSRLIPAEEFARSVKQGSADDFSIFRAAQAKEDADALARLQRASLSPEPAALPPAQYEGDPRYVSRGLKLKKTLAAPQTSFVSDGDVAGGETPKEPYRQLPRPPQLPQLPPGSSAPYALGPMTHNPSLWPDEAQGANLFTDFRAFQPMDVITIVVNESSVGSKKTNSKAEGTFDILAGISHLFGIETKSWASNNEAFDPGAIVEAKTENKYEGKGEMKREGSLKSQISAVIMEVLPNGLMRIEGTKIVSVDDEEEVMVLSGLVRSRDITSQNQVDSNRVANMRIDFYGRGVLGDQQSPGWGARLFEQIWPF